MKAGLLEVMDRYLPRLPHFLPPGHHVRANRLIQIDADQDGPVAHQVIIEGPMLPDWPDQSVQPSGVVLDMLMTHDYLKNRLVLSAQWFVDGTKSASWEIRSWSMDEIKANPAAVNDFMGLVD